MDMYMDMDMDMDVASLTTKFPFGGAVAASRYRSQLAVLTPYSLLLTNSSEGGGSVYLGLQPC